MMLPTRRGRICGCFLVPRHDMLERMGKAIDGRKVFEAA